jgi:hypothetical protein
MMTAFFFFYQNPHPFHLLIETNVTLLTLIYIIVYGQLTSN